MLAPKLAATKAESFGSHPGVTIMSRIASALTQSYLQALLSGERNAARNIIENAIAQDGHTAEFIKDQFRHCKTILAFGASQLLLLQAGLPVSMDKSMAQGGTGLILAAASDAASAAAEFIANLAKHRHFGREMDPPIL